MMWSFYDGWNALWMAGTMLLFLGVFISLMIWGIRAFSGPNRTDDQAVETLRRRLAAGEITAEEFERTKRVMQG
jgi:uncharacterized membrane protein